MNAVEIEQAITELSEQPFDRVEFPFLFLAAFGNKETTIKRLRAGVSNKSDVGGVLQSNNIHILTCDIGGVSAALKRIIESPATIKAKARFALATDGVDFEAADLEAECTVACSFMDFPDHFSLFLPLAGISTVRQIAENAFDIRATSRLNRLYVELLKDNPEWGTGERRHDMNHFMARLIFCFFAEDTSIFESVGQFTSTISQMTARDSSNTHEVIGELFRAMNTKRDERAGAQIPRWAEAFPYVNGGLFAGSTTTPKFSRIARAYLLQVGGLDWTKINPDIFGSMIQAVADDEERGELGMHYTSVPNILKVLNPLFLDDIQSKLAEAGDNHRTLLHLRKRIARIRVFDPACGSGNFLVIAYKSLRAIEAEINKRRGERGRRSEIPITNFRGIEIRDFSAEIARLALVITEFQCDVLHRGPNAALKEFLPLRAENWIVTGNALRLEWLGICPPTGTSVQVRAGDLLGQPVDQAEVGFSNEGGETYICGNPPYLGGKKITAEHKADLKLVFDGRSSNWKSLDYVSGWFMKAALYGEQAKAVSAFVSTNSICQGQQVAHLWPLILATGHQISFAHTSFRWSNLASHNAGVTVAVVGISRDPGIVRRLYSMAEDGTTMERAVSHINAYLVPTRDVYVRMASASAHGLTQMQSGSKMTDGSHLVFTKEEVDDIVQAFPEAERFFVRIVGGNDLATGVCRWSVWIDDHDAAAARLIPPLEARFEAVRTMRSESTKVATKALAATPHRFDERRFYRRRFVAIPQTSSEKREWLTCNYYDRDIVLIAPHLFMPADTRWELAIILSRLHLVWVATVCGKLETRYRYSNTLGWNTFPVPPLTSRDKDELSSCADEILLTREKHFPATIAELYESDEMPADLRAAHLRNDEVLERIYIGRRFRNDTERLERLFDLYTKMMSPAPVVAGKKRKAADKT
jgi:hypothetical protein